MDRCFGFVSLWRGVGVGNRLVATDWKSPDAGPALAEMQQNIADLNNLGYRQALPHQNVDGMNISTDLLTAASVIIAGSPSPHDVDDNYHDECGTRRFKQNMFYSLQSYSKPHQALFLTYAPRALPEPYRMELWIDAGNVRVTLASPAFFRKYRPRRGLNEDVRVLSNDVAVLCYLPQCHVPLLVWQGEKLDVSRSIARILQNTEGNLLTLGAFTLELELDIVEASSM